jgi:molecular chaperone DnaK
VKTVHEVREKGSAEEIKAAVERLEKASHKAAEELYKTAGAAASGADGGPQPPPAGAPGKKEDVVDAEYKQV